MTEPASQAQQERRTKRNIYLATMTLGLLAGTLPVVLAGDDFALFQSFYETLVPLVLLSLAGFILLLLVKPSSLRLVERLLVLLQYTYNFGLVAQIFYFGQPVRELVDTFLVWSPVLLVWTFLTFGRRDGLKVALLFVAGVVGLGLPYLLGLVPARPDHDAIISLLFIYFPVVSSVLLATLYAFSHFLEVNVAARAKAEAVAESALRDTLTGLPNRARFEARLNHLVEHAEEGPFALAFIDLDHFKNVNDTLGHPAGDQLLKEVAARMRAQVRQTDTLARISGDEFAVLFPGVASAEAVKVVAERLLQAFGTPVELAGHGGQTHARQVGASIGLALYPQHGVSANGLLTNADRAMYAVKGRGKNGYHLYSHAADEVDAAALEQALYGALAAEQFELHYQPIFDLRAGRVSAVEALVRWRHPERGLLAPASFIDVAEASDVIIDLGAWVLRTACAQAVLWRQGRAHLRLTVNVAARQLAQAGFVELVTGILAETGLAPEGLELELTERAVLSETAREHLSELRALGVGVSLDDFGAGYFSLSHLQTLPLSCFKLDRAFMQGLERGATRGNGLLMLQTIVALARALGIRVVAEGIETEAQLATLRSLACDEVQGYLLARPGAAVETTILLERKACLDALEEPLRRVRVSSTE